jgi:hypothetical protein
MISAGTMASLAGDPELRNTCVEPSGRFVQARVPARAVTPDALIVPLHFESFLIVWSVKESRFPGDPASVLE